MEVKSCRKCRRLFNYVAGHPICPACREEAEKEFQKVKKYIEENANSDIKTVAEACEVDPQQIKQWVKEERLQFSESSMIGLNCEACGTMIRSGKYCDKCKIQMTNGFKNAFGIGQQKASAEPDMPKKGNPKMRFLDN